MKMMSKSGTEKKKEEITLEARAIVPGLTMGPVFLFRKYLFDVDDFNFQVKDINKEVQKFRTACNDTIEQLKKTKELSEKIYKKQFIEIFESQIAILRDALLLEEIENVIRDEKRSAAYAVFTVFKDKKEYFLGLEKAYFKDRAFDVQDLKEKLLHTMFGIGAEYQVSIPSIIFTETLFPSDTMHFQRESILGFVTDTGGRTSHAAIIAQSLHIPYVINNHKLSKVIHDDDFVILDGYTGKIIINPNQNTIAEYVHQNEKYEAISIQLQSETFQPTKTLDGQEISIMANVGFLSELEKVKSVGAQGIGLFRTEGIFLEKDKIPDEQEQFEIYRRFSEEMKDWPIILRTLDTGGDKILSGLKDLDELNPFLGWRGIRFCLDEQNIFKSQLRAILRANINKNIKILLPMISCLTEIRMTKLLLREAKDELMKQGQDFYDKTDIGVMIETPSAVIIADILAEEVDFMSIGTNDLTQYTLAVDRTNSKISKLFNDMHPAILRMMRTILETTRSKKIEVSICGEMAGNPIAISILLGLGLRTLSLNTFQIPKIKKIIRLLTLTDCEHLVNSLLNLSTAEEVIQNTEHFFDAKIPNSELLK